MRQGQLLSFVSLRSFHSLQRNRVTSYLLSGAALDVTSVYKLVLILFTSLLRGWGSQSGCPASLAAWMRRRIVSGADQVLQLGRDSALDSSYLDI